MPCTGTHSDGVSELGFQPVRPPPARQWKQGRRPGLLLSTEPPRTGHGPPGGRPGRVATQ